ncbi:hypothetical protein HMPREF3216_01128, partial [Gardnerella vaginalis]
MACAAFVISAHANRRFSALCTKFDLNHVQKAEWVDGFCTIFWLNHVQKAENRSRGLSALCRSRRLAALTSSQRRSSASALSCSARKIAFARYASSAPAGWRAQLLVAARLIWH